jgi:hypothetical protein
MAQMSKRVAARIQNASYVNSSFTTHGSQIAAAVASELEEVTPEQVEAVMGAVARYLERKTQTLHASEVAYVKEQGDDPAAFQARDASFAVLRQTVAELRAFVSNSAPDRLKSLGLDAPPPDAQAQVLTYVEVIAAHFAKDQAPIRGEIGAVITPADTSALLTERLQNARATLKQVITESRELDAALITRDLALAAWQTAYSAASDALASFYQIAGASALAAKIRPTQRRTQGLDVITLAPSDATAADAAPASAAAPTADADTDASDQGPTS